ncbi:hypothetical protein [Planococcus soli]|uniref:hypothetical protein n=1 Tax=Planococcus soli TaxID=2666072 RepID=UPI00115F6DE3|nr:hypothetical protein [Planococcus soli]
MSESRKKDMKETGQEMLIDTFLNVGSEAGAEVIKQSVASAVGDIMVDTAASLIPGASGAYQSFKRTQHEKNMNRLISELSIRMEEIKRNLELKTQEQKSHFDEQFRLVLDTASDEQQEEKIKYMVNGLVHISEHEQLSDDFILTYYDVLKSMRIVDIGVLKLMYDVKYYFDRSSRDSYTDIMERHGITYEQYEAVRRNLLRLGLFTTKLDLNILGDLETIVKSVKDLNTSIEKLTSGKKINSLPRLKDPQLKSKENFEVSKFGRDFVNFFIEHEQLETSGEN